MITAYMIEGLDRLGKSTLIQNILNELGYFEVIHFQKPKALKAYRGDLQKYQEASFTNLFEMLHRAPRIICDRSHIGEAVYAEMYRGYSGDYVFPLEKLYGLHNMMHLKLVLLTEDFEKSKHFVDDGHSLGSIENRRKEQEKFILAYERSYVANRVMINVTAEDGSFRPAGDILKEAIGGTL